MTKTIMDRKIAFRKLQRKRFQSKKFKIEQKAKFEKKLKEKLVFENADKWIPDEAEYSIVHCSEKLQRKWILVPKSYEPLKIENIVATPEGVLIADLALVEFPENTIFAIDRDGVCFQLTWGRWMKKTLYCSCQGKPS